VALEVHHLNGDPIDNRLVNLIPLAVIAIGDVPRHLSG
jgi:hypothetical protein